MLKEALESIWNQTFSDYEILVVDDGSSDGTWDFLQSVNNRIKLCRQENSGPGAARNLGARKSEGRYLVFLDSDDKLLPWALDTYSSVISAHNSPAFIAAKPVFDSTQQVSAQSTVSGIRCQYFNDYLSSYDEWRWWGVSSFIIRKSAFQRIGGFIEKNLNAEDADLALRLGVEKGFVQMLSPKTFFYRKHEESRVGMLDSTIQGARNLVRAEKNHAYPGGVELSKQRRAIITRHVRPVVLSCLNHGRIQEAMRLYRATLQWNISLSRYRFLIGFWWYLLIQRIGKSAA